MPKSPPSPFAALPADDEAPYSVGYKRPPETGQFKPGQSGNPKGRPKGARNRNGPGESALRDLILEEANRDITVNDGGRETRLSVIRAAMRTLGLNAAKGQARAMQMFSQLVNEAEAAERKLTEDYFEGAIKYKFRWEQELERRKILGILGPAPIPHPDDIVIDFRAGTIRYKGPLTKEDAVAWETLWTHIDDMDQVVETIDGMLAGRLGPKRRAILEKSLADLEERRAFFIECVGRRPKGR